MFLFSLKLFSINFIKDRKEIEVNKNNTQLSVTNSRCILLKKELSANQ